MQVVDVHKLPNGDQDFDVEYTKDEVKEIKRQTGWQRLTKKRRCAWYLKVLEDHKKSRK